MKYTNMHQAKSQLSSLIEEILKGERVVICRSGNPVAELIPFKKKHEPRIGNLYKGQLNMSEDFDELPKDFLDVFTGES